MVGVSNNSKMTIGCKSILEAQFVLLLRTFKSFLHKRSKHSKYIFKSANF